MAPNDQVERQAGAPATIEAVLSQSSIPSLAHRRRYPAIARTMVRGHPCTNLRKRLPTCSREDWQRRSTKETCRPEPCAARKLGELRETKRHLRGRQGTYLGQPTSQRHPKIRSCRKPRPKRHRLGTRYAILNRNAQRYVCRTSEADLQLPLGRPEPLDLPCMSEMASNYFIGDEIVAWAGTIYLMAFVRSAP